MRNSSAGHDCLSRGLAIHYVPQRDGAVRHCGFNGETMTKLHGVPVSFHQGCPVCGRLLCIGVTLLGKPVYCQHCGGRFVAADPSAGPSGSRARDRRVEDLIERAEAALQQAAESSAADAGWHAHE